MLFLTKIKLMILKHLPLTQNIDNHYFEGIVGHIYPIELQLNKAKYFDT